MTITIHIDSPELTSAIRDLTGVMLSAAMNSAVKVNIQEPAGQPAPQVMPVQTAPVQPALVVQHAVTPTPPAVVQAPIPAAPQAPTVAPTAAVSYSISQLSVAAMQLKDQGRIADLQGLLAQFGVQAMTQLRPDQLPDFAMALIGMGVKI